MWIFYTLIYGLIKGIREIVKKESLKKNSVMEVLLIYTFLSFIIVTPGFKDAINMSFDFLWLIAVKSLCVFLAWILSFYAIKNLPISLYGVIDLSRVMFSTLLAVVVLGEKLYIASVIGLILVSLGLFLLRNPFYDKLEKIVPSLIFMAMGSCLLNACSGLLDKILMKDLSSTQLQFWYMLFLLAYYILYILFTRTKINIIDSLKNPWIWLLAILFVIGDKALFIANGYSESKITNMTLLKQSSCIITLLAGKFIYKEKDILHKLICAIIIICGILISTVFS